MGILTTESSGIPILQSREAYERVIKNNHFAVIVFSEQNCYACFLFGPVISRLASACKDRVAIYGVTDEQEWARDIFSNFNSVPVTEFCRDGDLIDTLNGALAYAGVVRVLLKAFRSQNLEALFPKEEGLAE